MSGVDRNGRYFYAPINGVFPTVDIRDNFFPPTPFDVHGASRATNLRHGPVASAFLIQCTSLLSKHRPAVRTCFAGVVGGIVGGGEEGGSVTGGGAGVGLGVIETGTAELSGRVDATTFVFSA